MVGIFSSQRLINTTKHLIHSQSVKQKGNVDVRKSILASCCFLKVFTAKLHPDIRTSPLIRWKKNSIIYFSLTTNLCVKHKIHTLKNASLTVLILQKYSVTSKYWHQNTLKVLITQTGPFQNSNIITGLNLSS